MTQSQTDDWLAGAWIEAEAELPVPGQSIELEIEIPEDDHDGEPPLVS